MVEPRNLTNVKRRLERAKLWQLRALATQQHRKEFNKRLVEYYARFGLIRRKPPASHNSTF